MSERYLEAAVELEVEQQLDDLHGAVLAVDDRLVLRVALETAAGLVLLHQRLVRRCAETKREASPANQECKTQPHTRVYTHAHTHTTHTYTLSNTVQLVVGFLPFYQVGHQRSDSESAESTTLC